MPLDAAEMDRLMDRHFEFEMADDVEGVLSTLATDAVHDIVGAPGGATIGHDATRPTYTQLFADLAGDRVETLHRSYGPNTLTDESLWVGRAVGSPMGIAGDNRPLQFRILHVMTFTDDGLIARENVWLDDSAVVAQLSPNQKATEGTPQ